MRKTVLKYVSKHKLLFVFAHIPLTYIKKMLENRNFIRKSIAVSKNSCTFASEKISSRFLVR